MLSYEIVEAEKQLSDKDIYNKQVSFKEKNLSDLI